MIVAYCERINFAAEPLNAISNTAFVLPFAFGLYLLSKTDTLSLAGASQYTDQKSENPPVSTQHPANESGYQPAKSLGTALVILPMTIAVGSALFHANPSHLTQTLDILPIALFSLLAGWIIFRRAFGSVAPAALLLAGWMSVSALAGSWTQILAGSLFYVPTLCLLWFSCLYVQTERHRLLPVATLFSIALLARALDLPLCSAGRGTHALWHFFSALACCGLILTCLRPVTQTRNSGSET